MIRLPRSGTVYGDLVVLVSLALLTYGVFEIVNFFGPGGTK